MERWPAKLPPLSRAGATHVHGYTLEDGGRTLRLWIGRSIDSAGPVRVFTAEAEDQVAVLVVPTPEAYKIGWTADWTEDEIAADLADVIATLDAPLGDRPLIDPRDRSQIPPLPQRIHQLARQSPAPRLRPIGTL